MVQGLGQVDLTDLDVFSHGFPHDLFRIHREEAPVWWHEATAHTPDGEGFWSVATYDEVLRVLRDPVIFSSETGGDRPYGGTIIQDLPVAGVVLNMMDDPRHARIRRLVTKGLTPAAVRNLERELRRRMRVLLESVDEECDFLVDVAAELPMQAICLLLGVPEADRHLLFDAVEHIFDIPDESDFLSMSAATAGRRGADVRIRRGTDSGETRQPPPGHALDRHPRRAPRRRTAPPERRRALCVLLAAVLGGRRDHSQRHRRSHARLRRVARTAQPLAVRAASRSRPRSRRSCAGPHRRPPSGGRRPRRASSAARRSGRGRRSSSGRDRPTGTPADSPSRTRSG